MANPLLTPSSSDSAGRRGNPKQSSASGIRRSLVSIDQDRFLFQMLLFGVVFCAGAVTGMHAVVADTRCDCGGSRVGGALLVPTKTDANTEAIVEQRLSAGEK